VAFIFLFSAVLEIVLTVRQGWNSSYLGVVVTPVGISVFMSLYGFLLHRRSPRFDNA